MRPRTPLTPGSEHHPVNDTPLPEKRASSEANLGVADGGVAILVVDAIECAFNTSKSMEPRTLADAISRPDAASWIAAALAEIEAHLKNGTW